MTDLIEKAGLVAPSTRMDRWLAESRALSLLAAPLIFTQLAQMAIFTTDIILLGRLSHAALAAAAIGNTVYYFAWLIGGGPASAVSPMIAHIRGVRLNDKANVRAALRMGLWAIILMAAPMMLVLWWGRPILIALGQDPALAADAGRFLAMLSFGLPCSLAFMVLRNFTTALGHPRAGLWVMAVTIGFNALAGYGLIFGHFGLPRLGIVGSGIATSCSAVFSCLAMIAIIQATADLRSYRMFRRFFRVVHVKLAEIFRLGLPIGLAMIFEAMLFNAMTLVMGRFGAAALAAHQIAMNVASITFMVPLGIGMAATVRIGMAAGAGDLGGARRSGMIAIVVGLSFISLCAAGMALFGGPIAGLYLGAGSRDDAAVIVQAALFLRVAAAFQVFDATQVIATQCLRGLKDARAPMLIAAGCYWLIGAPACIILAFPLHLQGLGIWVGLAIGLAAAAAAMLARFARLTGSPPARMVRMGK